MLDHKTSLRKFNKIEIKHHFDHNTIKLEINYKKKTAKSTNMWRLNNILLNNKWVTEVQRGTQKLPGGKWKWKHSDPKSMGYSKCSSKRKVYSDTSLLKETFKISNNQPNFKPKRTRKRTNKTQS